MSADNNNIELEWDESNADDFAYYEVYSRDELAGYTTETNNVETIEVQHRIHGESAFNAQGNNNSVKSLLNRYRYLD